ncbi:hypothetical protein D3C84_1219710 [compost metagenome]
MTGHVIANKSNINASLLKLEGGQARALQNRASLVGKYADVHAAFLGQIEWC